MSENHCGNYILLDNNEDNSKLHKLLHVVAISTLAFSTLCSTQPFNRQKLKSPQVPTFEVVQRSENFSSFSLPSTQLAEPGGLGKLWLAMALAVTDALDGGISLDEGGTRAHGAFT